MQDSLRKVASSVSTIEPVSVAQTHATKCTLRTFGFIAVFGALTLTTACKRTASTDNTLPSARYTHTAYKNDNAFSGRMVLHNLSNKPLTNWTVALPMYNANIDSIENAGFVLNDTAYVFSPTSSNSTIAAHDSVVFTFSGTTTKDFKLPEAAFLQKNVLSFAANRVYAPKGSIAPHKVELLAYPSDFVPTKDIRLGEGRLYPVWEQSSDATIPRNRKTWAMAMAHAHKLFTNTTHAQGVPLSFYFATTIKETFCSCDPNITVSNQKFPLVYVPKSQGQGCFQMEYGTAFQELQRAYPERFAPDSYGKIIANEHFETAALSKAHYDIFSIKFLEVAKGYDPRSFFAEANDSTSAMKIIALSYHQGLWNPLLENIFVKNRKSALAAADLSTQMGNDWRTTYNVKSLANYATLLNGQPKKLDKQLQSINPQTQMPFNMFYGFYDETIAWSDVEQYIQKISPMYGKQNWQPIKARLKKVFDEANGGDPISFRYQYGKVLDQLVLSLPTSDPSNYIAHRYGDKIQYASGGASSRAVAKK
jgi:Cellulose binding domain